MRVLKKKVQKKGSIVKELKKDNFIQNHLKKREKNKALKMSKKDGLNWKKLEGY